MTPEHQTTLQESAYWRMLDEVWETLSWPAQALFRKASTLAYEWHMQRSYFPDAEEAWDKMGFVAEGLIDRDQELLTRIVRAARTAANSLDPEDDETVAGFRVHPANLHRWYEMTAQEIERTLRKENARRRAMKDPSYRPY